jgi:sensor histidine kinase YesM
MISGLAIIMGILFFALSLYLIWKDKKMTEMFPLGIFSLLLGLWRFTDTEASPYLAMDKPVFFFYLSVMSLMVGVIPFAKAIKGRVRLDLIDIYCLLTGIVNVVVIGGNILGLIEIREYLPMLQAILVVGVGLVAINLIKAHDKRNFKPGDEIERIAFWILIAGIVVDSVIFFKTGSSEGLVFMLVSFLVAILTKGISFVYVYLRNENMLLVREKELVNSRATVMMGQIRSHFVFNILNAISGMCKYDPEKADETVVRFSKYLRANVDLMQKDEPVNFRLVIERLDDYIALEQVRFGDKIRLEKDIQIEDFMMPALIIQPIVENAIKHGIQPKEGPGTITLKTYEENDNIIIKNTVLYRDRTSNFFYISIYYYKYYVL